MSKLEGDLGPSLARPGRDLHDSFDGGHGVFQGVDDVGLHDLGEAPSQDTETETIG